MMPFSFFLTRYPVVFSNQKKTLVEINDAFLESCDFIHSSVKPRALSKGQNFNQEEKNGARVGYISLFYYTTCSNFFFSDLDVLLRLCVF